MLTLAGALQERGHEVLWATGANACRLVQAAGLEAVEAGLSDAEAAPIRAAARQAAVGILPQDVPTVVFPLLFGAARATPMLAVLIPEDDGRPLVYLTLGTVSNRVDVLQAVAAAVSALDVRLLVTVGPDVDPEALGRVPAGVRVLSWVPQAAVLPRCSAVVSHGG